MQTAQINPTQAASEDGDLKELITTFKKSCFSLLNKAMLFRHYFQQFRKIKASRHYTCSCLEQQNTFCLFLSIIYNKPLFISEHWSGYQNHIGFIQKGLMKLVFKRAEKILPVSHFLKNLMQRQGINGSFEIIGNIIEKQKTKAVKGEVFRFLIVADLRDEIKNISSVITVFKN